MCRIQIMIVYKCLHDVNHVFCSDLKEKKYAHVIINIYFFDNFSTKVSQPIANIPTKSFFLSIMIILMYSVLFLSWQGRFTVYVLYMFCIYLLYKATFSFIRMYTSSQGWNTFSVSLSYLVIYFMFRVWFVTMVYRIHHFRCWHWIRL